MNKNDVLSKVCDGVKRPFTYRGEVDSSSTEKYDVLVVDDVDTLEEGLGALSFAMENLKEDGKVLLCNCMPMEDNGNTLYKLILLLSKYGIGYDSIDVDGGICMFGYSESFKDVIEDGVCDVPFEEYFHKRVDCCNINSPEDFFFECGYYFISPYNMDTWYKIKPEDKDKVILICVAKYENEHIREFVEHYKKLNFDKVIIGDNNPIGDYSLNEILEDYVSEGFVDIYDCHGFERFQTGFYDMFSTRGLYKWAAFYDCDEYLEIPAYDDIKVFLDNCTSDCVLFHWMSMSNDGQISKTKGSYEERFKHPRLPIIDCAENGFCKSIVRGGKKFLFNGTPHTPMGEDKDAKYSFGLNGEYVYETFDNVMLTFKDGYIKHYSCLSAEECIEKQKRGYPDDMVTDVASISFRVGQNRYYTLDEYFDSYRFQPYQLLYKYKEQIENYRYIYFKPWSYMTYLQALNDFIWLLKTFENKVFIFDYEINESIYNTVLGFSFQTTNRVACARSFDEYSSIGDRFPEEMYIIKMY